jgi:hypothetical protein
VVDFVIETFCEKRIYIMIIKKRAADSYIGTYTNAPKDVELLAVVRGLVSKINKVTEKKWYLKKHGRGPRMTEAVKSYYKEKYPRITDRGIKFTTNQELPLQFAEYFDLYLYQR